MRSQTLNTGLGILSSLVPRRDGLGTISCKASLHPKHVGDVLPRQHICPTLSASGTPHSRKCLSSHISPWPGNIISPCIWLDANLAHDMRLKLTFLGTLSQFTICGGLVTRTSLGATDARRENLKKKWRRKWEVDPDCWVPRGHAALNKAGLRQRYHSGLRAPFLFLCKTSKKDKISVSGR